MQTEIILQNIKKHINLDQSDADFFISLLESRSVKKKEFLLKEGETCRYESFITSGCLRSYSIDNNGFEHILLFGIEGWWIADLYSFLTQTPSNLFIDALENTELIQLSKPNLDKLFETVPKFERFFRIILQNGYIAQQQRINQNLSSTAEERYQQFLHKYPTLDQRISQKQIASFLGITPVFLSMIRKKMAKR